MRSEQKTKGIIKSLSHFFTFFLLVAFVITCCILLFITVLSRELGIVLDRENISVAAKLTFLNVVIISLIFTAIDTVRRRITVDRPVRQISEAAERMMQGDFSIRIPLQSGYVSDGKFNEIIECINKMAEELSSVETLRTDFIANVSHEMKTPLSVIRNYATLLKEQGLSEEKRIEYSRIITDASRRLSDMMTNILKLNRLENQKIYPKAETFELDEQLCECLLQYENVWLERGIDIVIDIEEGVNIKADPELLSLVWNNLLSNAFKFTADGGKIKLSLTTDEEYAIVKVADNGCGMTPEVGAHIFEKFYQGDSSRATQGNGLGLALVKRVIDIMKGEIEVESSLSVGTTFTVKIRRD